MCFLFASGIYQVRSPLFDATNDMRVACADAARQLTPLTTGMIRKKGMIG